MNSDDQTFEDDRTPPEIRRIAEDALREIKEAKSETIAKDKRFKGRRYEHAYISFDEWRVSNNYADLLSENVMMEYFHHLSIKYKPSSLSTHFSMLKSTISIKYNVNIGNYHDLQAFLKKKWQGFISEKPKILSSEHINRFLTEAPDKHYLDIKVALIVGVAGGCTMGELRNLRVYDIEDREHTLCVSIPNEKTPRYFSICEGFFDIVQKYRALRPKTATTDRFFLKYRFGRCTTKNIAKKRFGMMSEDIATFLQLPDAKLYTGHSLRLSAITLFARPENRSESKNHEKIKPPISPLNTVSFEQSEEQIMNGNDLEEQLGECVNKFQLKIYSVKSLQEHSNYGSAHANKIIKSEPFEYFTDDAHYCFVKTDVDAVDEIYSAMKTEIKEEPVDNEFAEHVNSNFDASFLSDCNDQMESDHCSFKENHINQMNLKDSIKQELAESTEFDLIKTETSKEFQEFLIHEEFVDSTKFSHSAIMETFSTAMEPKYLPIGLQASIKKTVRKRTFVNPFISVETIVDSKVKPKPCVAKKKQCLFDWCPFEYHNRNTFQLHLQTVHSGKTKSSYSCRFCPKNFSSRGSVGMHINAAHKEEKYKCDICSQRFCRVKHLRKHSCVGKYSVRQLMECVVCGSKFTNKAALIAHVRSHEKALSCNFCPRTYYYRSNLLRHIKFSHKENSFTILET